MMYDARDGDDRELRAALRAAVPQPPVDEVDWIGLHARITAAAAPVRRAAQPRAWWQPLAAWSGGGIPLAAAASLLLMIAAGALRVTPAADAAASFHTVEEELAWSVAVGARPLLADATADEILDVALFHEPEDWQR
jgi:hypothetical protein